MTDLLTERIRVHDLLEVDCSELWTGEVFGLSCIPDWVQARPDLMTFVHVRRGVENEGWVPIGVRGTSRSQRWATVCHRHSIRSITPPERLLSEPIPDSRACLIPAFQALEDLKGLWSGLDFPWGPAGSVGYELLTHRKVTTAESDLDVVIHAQRRMTKSEAAHLSRLAECLPQRVDIRVETDRSGFLLREYANELTTRYVLRTGAGEILDQDPWNPGV